MGASCFGSFQFNGRGREVKLREAPFRMMEGNEVFSCPFVVDVGPGDD